jgi:hypothetical protein
MLPNTFEEAMAMWHLMRSIRLDLPDGQFEDAKEMVKEYVLFWGSNLEDWPEETKAEFVENMVDNIQRWL